MKPELKIREKFIKIIKDEYEIKKYLSPYTPRKIHEILLKTNQEYKDIFEEEILKYRKLKLKRIIK